MRSKLPTQLAANKQWIILNKYPYAGDLTGDDKVDIRDVMAACRILARKSVGDRDLTPEQIDRGDIDGNGDVTIQDVMAICKIIASKV